MSIRVPGATHFEGIELESGLDVDCHIGDNADSECVIDFTSPGKYVPITMNRQSIRKLVEYLTACLNMEHTAYT